MLTHVPSLASHVWCVCVVCVGADIELSKDSKVAVKRLLDCDGDDYYQLLGVAATSDASKLKKAYRLQSLRVHPDKTSEEGAEEAFQKLSVAYEALGDPEERGKYHAWVNNDIAKEQFTARFGEDLKGFYDELNQQRENQATKLQCSNCHKLHPKEITDRRLLQGRYCAECNAHHPAREGDIWAETRYVYRWHFYACMDGAIYEINDWAECAGLHNKIKPNAHDVLVTCRDPKDQKPRTTGRKQARRGGGKGGRPADKRPTAADFDSPEDFIQFLFDEHARAAEGGAKASGTPPQAKAKKKKKKK